MGLEGILFLAAVIVAASCAMLKYAGKFPGGAGMLKCSLSEFILLLFMTFSVLYIGIGLAKLGARFFPGDVAMGTLFPTAMFQALMIAAVFAFFKMAKLGSPFGKLSFRACLVGCIFFVYSLVIVMFLGAEISLIYEIFTGEYPARQNVVEIFNNLEGTYAFMLGIFSVVFLAPIAEELIFRGVLYRISKSWLVHSGFSPTLSAWLSALATALLFALVHANFFAFFPLVAMGVILVFAYEKSSSIISPIITHSLFNCANIALLFISK